MTRATRTFTVTVQSSSVPQYVQTLSAFSVAALSTVTNGKPLFLNADNLVWDDAVIDGGPDPGTFNVRNMVVESGGFSSPSRRLLFAHGGGHADSAFNGIMQFDLNGTTQATGWTLVPGSASPIAQIPTGTGDWNTYLDGKAGSIHAYDGMCFDEGSNTMVRAMGSMWSSGKTAGADSGWYFDFNTGAWIKGALIPALSTATVSGALFHHPGKRKVAFGRGTWGRFFDFATRTWGGGYTSSVDSFRLTGCFDWTRNRAIVVGKSFMRHAIMNFDTETCSAWSTFTATGDTAILLSPSEGVGVCYDETLDRFWLFGAYGAPFDRIYWIDAADFADGAVTVQSTPLSMTIPARTTGAGSFDGLYKRFCFIPEWRAIAVATTYDYPVHIIRLP